MDLVWHSTDYKIKVGDATFTVDLAVYDKGMRKGELRVFEIKDGHINHDLALAIQKLAYKEGCQRVLYAGIDY